MTPWQENWECAIVRVKSASWITWWTQIAVWLFGFEPRLLRFNINIIYIPYICIHTYLIYTVYIYCIYIYTCNTVVKHGHGNPV